MRVAREDRKDVAFQLMNRAKVVLVADLSSQTFATGLFAAMALCAVGCSSPASSLEDFEAGDPGAGQPDAGQDAPHDAHSDAANNVSPSGEAGAKTDGATNSVGGDAASLADAASPGDAASPKDAASAGDAASSADSAAVTSVASAGSVPIKLAGSLQNPCWSPTGDRLALTRFQTSYNSGNSDIVVAALSGTPATLVTTAASDNVNLPGSCWSSALGRIVYSSDAVDRDEIWTVAPQGGAPTRITNRSNAVAWEPSFSPDGQWVTFESHNLAGSDPGTIWKVKIDGTGLVQLTSGGDDREPNWSPKGDRILFQSLRSGNWDIWTMNVDGSQMLQVTKASGDDTDASYSPDGQRIVYSSDGGGSLNFADLFVIPAAGGTPVQVHAAPASDYAGAPSWSPDGHWLAFETCTGDPDTSPGTHIGIVAAP
jgi:TolB protein